MFCREMDSDNHNAPAFPMRVLYGFQSKDFRLPDEIISDTCSRLNHGVNVDLAIATIVDIEHIAFVDGGVVVHVIDRNSCSHPIVVVGCIAVVVVAVIALPCPWM